MSQEPGKIRNVAVVGHRGTGKTSLLASWLAAEPRQVAWLTPRPQLTEAGFWAEWLAAVQRVAPPRSAVRRLAGPRSGTPAQAMPSSRSA